MCLLIGARAGFIVPGGEEGGEPLINASTVHSAQYGLPSGDQLIADRWSDRWFGGVN